MSLVNVIGGFLSAGNRVTPAKYVEAPLASAEFAPFPTLEEVVSESFQRYMDVVIENRVRRDEIDRRTW